MRIARYLQSDARTPRADSAASAAVAALTEREVEVLLLVAKELANNEIATELFISPHTAKTHVNRIMVKTHCHDRVQLVPLAYESGLLAPGE